MSQMSFDLNAKKKNMKNRLYTAELLKIEEAKLDPNETDDEEIGFELPGDMMIDEEDGIDAKMLRNTLLKS